MPPHALEFRTDEPVRIHRNTPWEQIFRSYTPFVDGGVRLATYSFELDVLSEWARLLPFFQLTVAPGRGGGDQYERAAARLAKRHPLAEVRVAPGLHTKAVFFEGTGKLYLGSQNLFGLGFDDTIVEISVPPRDRPAVAHEIFETIAGVRALVPVQGVRDVAIYADGPLAGYANVEANRTYQFWDLAYPNNRVRIVDGRLEREPGKPFEPGRIYHLLVYENHGRTSVLALDRGYAYCGDLDESAYQWLTQNCRIRAWQEPHEHGFWAGALAESSPEKDHIFRIHPATQAGPPTKGIFIDEVLDPTAHRHMWVSMPPLDLTAKMLVRDEPR